MIEINEYGFQVLFKLHVFKYTFLLQIRDFQDIFFNQFLRISQSNHRSSPFFSVTITNFLTKKPYYSRTYAGVITCHTVGSNDVQYIIFIAVQPFQNGGYYQNHNNNIL